MPDSPWPLIALALIAPAAMAPRVLAEPPIPGPIRAEVVRIIDGDTIEVRAHVWPGIWAEYIVRLDGLDAPEARGACPAVRVAAAAATAALTAHLAAGIVYLREIRPGRYARRALARVEAPLGRDLAPAMIAGGHGLAYGGEGRGARCGEDDRDRESGIGDRALPVPMQAEE